MTKKTTSDSESRNGKLAIPLPFEEAVKAATEVPADKLPPPPSKQKPRQKEAAKK